MEPGPRNAITDVEGVRVGQAENRRLLTGTTVILPDAPVPAAVDVRGGGPGTRELDALRPGGLVERIQAIVLSGGSAYGLDAAGGVMDWLRREGRGLRIGAATVPIVPCAILFDLLTGPPPEWDAPPWFALGRDAASAARHDIRIGNAGAGIGATAGPLKGGTGTASIRVEPFTVGALSVANPLGSVLMPGTRTFWGWWLERDGELGGQRPPAHAPPDDLPEPPALAAGNTTLGVVATDAALDRSALARIAVMAQDGLARTIRPVHSPLDGDTVFALSTGRVPLRDPVGDLLRLGHLAADTLARAVMRGVYEAEGLAGYPGYRDGAGSA